MTKRKRKIPLKNWEVEKAVVDNALRLANEKGLQPDFIKSIMRQLIKESKIQQEIHHFSDYEGAKENFLIIGGLGGMGRWFSLFFQNQGHNVSIYDTAGKSEEFKNFDELDKGLKDSSYVVIATSLETVPDIIDKIIESGFEGIVFDVASLKSHLEPAMSSAIENGISITSIHPMFGPDARTLSDKVICFCDCGNEDANNRVKGLFSDTAASLVTLSFEKHDEIMSYVLALSHIVNTIFVKMLMEGGYSSEELDRIGSTTYFSQMVTASSVINENPDLYYSIQNKNPFKNRLFSRLKETTNEVTQMIIEENKDEFTKLMKDGSYWVDHSDKS